VRLHLLARQDGLWLGRRFEGGSLDQLGSRAYATNSIHLIVAWKVTPRYGLLMLE